VLIVSRWSGESVKDLSEAGLRASFVPPERYRVSACLRLLVGETAPGFARAGRAFVLGGLCRFQAGESAVVPEGYFVELPEGRYAVTNVGKSEARVVFVWELPPSFWQTSPDPTPPVSS
jgi:hypothetical protein